MPEVKWRVDYKGHPKPHLEWWDPQSRVIPPFSSDGKYLVNTTEHLIFLTIRKPQLADAGTYTLKAHNNLIEKTQQFQLVVEG